MVEFEPEQLARRILSVLLLVFGALVVPTQLYIIQTGLYLEILNAERGQNF